VERGLPRCWTALVPIRSNYCWELHPSRRKTEDGGPLHRDCVAHNAFSPRTKYTFGLWRLAGKAHNTCFGLLRPCLVLFFGQWTHIFMIAKAYKSNHHVMVGVSKVDLPLPGTRRNQKRALSKHTDHRSKHAWSIFQAISCCPCDPRYTFDISKYLQ
jgi:hypothetical protein